MLCEPSPLSTTLSLSIRVRASTVRNIAPCAARTDDDSKIVAKKLVEKKKKKRKNNVSQKISLPTGAELYDGELCSGCKYERTRQPSVVW
jgi:hypothetical protein